MVEVDEVRNKLVEFFGQDKLAAVRLVDFDALLSQINSYFSEIVDVSLFREAMLLRMRHAGELSEAALVKKPSIFELF